MYDFQFNVNFMRVLYKFNAKKTLQSHEVTELIEHMSFEVIGFGDRSGGVVCLNFSPRQDNTAKSQQIVKAEWLNAFNCAKNPTKLHSLWSMPIHQIMNDYN